ncbi:HD domain-containing protein [Nonomuraea dietziae]|uniref:HD domain-containing protein n=1 Tax=Nonomuraea dietziae TaxID=65515 RepID=UPI003CD09D29
MAETVNVDLALWGKSRGLSEPYSLVWHLLDAAAAVEALWDHYLPSGPERLPCWRGVVQPSRSSLSAGLLGCSS